MIGSTRQLRVYAYITAVDMRKGVDTLHGLVQYELGHDPLSGDVFVFVSRDRKRAKALYWDGTGLCLYSKRLERGCFARLWRAPSQSTVSMTMNELQLFLEGSRLVGRVVLSPPEYVHKSLAVDMSP